MESQRFEINPSVIFRFLAAVTTLLIVLSTASVAADAYAGHNSLIAHKLMKLFYVELEDNVPSYFSTLQLALASGALFVVAFMKRKARDKYALEWMILAFGFLAMSFDELIAVHERLIEPMRELLGEGQLGIFYFAWIIPMGVLVTVLGVLLFGFWWNLPTRTKVRFLIAGSLFLLGAVGCEMVESKHSEIYGRETFFYIAMTTIEEALEMFSIAFFIKSLVTYAYETFGAVEFKLAGNGLQREAAHTVTERHAAGRI